VATLSTTGAIDSIEDGITGLVVPVNKSIALTESLKRLLADRSLAVQFGRVGRCRVLREFAPDRVWSALANEYRYLAKTSPHSQSAHLAGPVCSGEAALLEEANDDIER